MTRPRVLDFLHHAQLSDSPVSCASFLTFLSCRLYLAANQQRERHARLVAPHQGTQRSRAGLGDGHSQQCHQLPRQLHHTSDDICIRAPVLSVPNELHHLPPKKSITMQLHSPAADVIVCLRQLITFFFFFFLTLCHPQ